MNVLQGLSIKVFTFLWLLIYAQGMPILSSFNSCGSNSHKAKSHHKQQQQMQTNYTILVHSSHNSWTIIFALSLNVLLV